MGNNTTLLRRELGSSGEIVDVIEDNPALFPELERAKAFAETHGFVELPKDILNTVIPDLELDLAEQGSVTVYNCLFEDQGRSSRWLQPREVLDEGNRDPNLF